MKIITDTATLISPVEGEQMGIKVIPACAVVDGTVYRDYTDISNEEFLEMIKEGGIPTSSQPAVGDLMDAFEEDKEDILFLSIGDGLSGGYANAVGVKNSMDHNEHIHIVDTKTLAGPERYLVKKAVQLKEAGLHIERIKEELKKCIETSVSFVIPVDFEFLKRSGRLTPIAAKIGGIIKIVPVMTQTADKRRIELFVIKRSRKKAVESIINHLKTLGVDKNYLISISHAGAYENAKSVLNQIQEHFSDTMIELLHLSPALMTHGGPGSIVIQAIKK